MALIGNDIMFFSDNAQTFIRKGVSKKIISENESLFSFSNNLHINLIIAWTIKESIYKIQCQKGYRKAFAPINFPITEFTLSGNGIYSGKAAFQNSNYFFHSQIKNDFVYTYASDQIEALSKIEHHFFKNNISNNSCLSNIEFVQFLDHKKWQLTHSDCGFPIISDNKLPINISLTHDHNLMILCVHKR